MFDPNKNIEFIIPGKLPAVKFSYIPFIPEIEYAPDPDEPAFTEACRITDAGLFLLNKDKPGYELMKSIMQEIVPLSLHQLNRKRAKIANKRCKVPYEELYELCLGAELERREEARKGVT